jgi:hypothetical protein
MHLRIAEKLLSHYHYHVKIHKNEHKVSKELTARRKDEVDFLNG